MEIWPFSWHKKQSTSKLNHDILENRLDLSPIPPLDCFFPGDGRREMERDTVMIGIVMDANTNWIAYFFSLLEGLLHRKTHNTFTTSKDRSNFYHTHFRVAEPGKRGRTKLKQPLKTIKWGWRIFRNQSEWRAATLELLCGPSFSCLSVSPPLLALPFSLTFSLPSFVALSLWAGVGPSLLHTQWGFKKAGQEVSAATRTLCLCLYVLVSASRLCQPLHPPGCLD